MLFLFRFFYAVSGTKTVYDLRSFLGISALLGFLIHLFLVQPLVAGGGKVGISTEHTGSTFVSGLLLLLVFCYYLLGVLFYRKIEPLIEYSQQGARSTSDMMRKFKNFSVPELVISFFYLDGLVKQAKSMIKETPAKEKDILAVLSSFDFEKVRQLQNVISSKKAAQVQYFKAVLASKVLKAKDKSERIEQDKSFLSKKGVSQQVIEKAAQSGEGELQKLIANVDLRVKLMTEAEMVGATVTATRLAAVDTAYTNSTLSAMLHTVRELQEKAESLGCLDEVIDLISADNIQSASNCVKEVEAKKLREVRWGKFSAIKSKLKAGQYKKYESLLLVVNAALGDQKSFERAIHDAYAAFGLKEQSF